MIAFKTENEKINEFLDDYFDFEFQSWEWDFNE